ncbi:MAG: hypothetical protein ACXVEE_34575 [Polyangiales bacterium]
MSEKGRAAKLFEGLANAILERGRPRVIAWLQARFGSGADLGALRFEDAQVQLEDARVPLTAKMRLAIARASIEVVSVAPPRIALSSLEGELVTDGGLRAEVRFAGEKHDGEAWVHGLFTVVRATWPGGHEPLSGSLRVTVTSDRWTLEDGALGAAEARLALSGRGDIDAEGLSVIEEAKLVIEGARAAPFADALRAIMDLSFDLGAFADAIVAGTIVARGASAEVALTARASVGTVHVTGLAADAIDLKFEGEIAIVKALAIASVAERFHPVQDDRARVEGTLRGPTRNPRMNLRADLGELHFARGTVTPITLEADVTLEGKRPVGTFTARAWGSDVRGDLGEHGVEVRFEDASSRLIDDLLLVAHVDTKLAFPTGVRISGVAHLARVVTGELAIETEGTAVLCALRFENGWFSGTKLRGRLSLADARTLGWLPASVRPEGSAKIVGEVEKALTVDVAAPKATVDLASLVVQLRDVVATVIVGDGVAIENARANAHGGTILASGVVDRAWNVRLEAVRIEELSPAIAREVRGLLTGNARIERGSGTAQLRLDHPVYPAIARLAPHVEKLGLSLPKPEGIAPLDATLSFEPDVVRVNTLAASVDGVTLTGAGALGPARALSGRLYASASPRWLQTSAILAIPALFTSNVTVPISLAGTLSEPKIHADTSSVLKNAIGFDPIGAATDLASAFGSIWSPPKPRPAPAPPPHAPARERSELDVVLDRILDHDPESEALIGRLVDRGIDPDEFERLLEARRRARRA